MNSRDRQICEKILSEITVANELLKDVPLEHFISDERTARAVCMTLINIGELVKNLTPELKDAHREIPWRAISGMRDITAHKIKRFAKRTYIAPAWTIFLYFNNSCYAWFRKQNKEIS